MQAIDSSCSQSLSDMPFFVTSSKSPVRAKYASRRATEW